VHSEGGGPTRLDSVSSEPDPRARTDEEQAFFREYPHHSSRTGNSPASRLGAWCSIALSLLLTFGLTMHAKAEIVDAVIFDLEYRALLLDLGQRDQALRTGLASCVRQPTAEQPPCFQRMRETDADQMAELHALLWSRGWPLASRVGEDAAFSAFLVIQHANSGVQAAALPAVAVSVWQGELKPVALALLTDRLLTRAGRAQRYGTQSMRWPHWPVTVRLPVLEPEKLDERRRALGLSPIP
jgi:hypothetical protein